MTSDVQQLRREILDKVEDYARRRFGGPARPFAPGTDEVAYAGRVFDHEELTSLVDSCLDFWLTAGRYCEQLEAALERFLDVRFALLCNSGSSANLLALSALTSPKLGSRQLQPGDEVITVAAGFPTTVNPIIQNQLVPVFVDVDLETYNIDVSQLELARSPRTRAIMLAHTLGNPFDLQAVVDFARRHDLWLVEDNCDALGARYDGQFTGSFGDLSTCSFYPAHHITTGEGGCVMTSNPELNRLVESFRDWGRDCWCAPGACDTCGKRFAWQFGDLPRGYDHKYVYSHVGYNLKMTEMQAAIGVAQMKKLPSFIAQRRQNWQHLHDRLQAVSEFLLLPRATPGSEPSWFGFAMTVRPGAPFTRQQLLLHLQERRIATRLLFGGDLRRQPAYAHVHSRSIGPLPKTDVVMHDMFWIGVYPKLSASMLDYVSDTIVEFVERQCRTRAAA